MNTEHMAETLETVVRDSEEIALPREVQKMLRIRSGDRIRWMYHGDKLVAEVIRKKKRALTPLIGKFGGEPTDSVESHNLTGT
jgi:antitoxin component of MazEF toxin-antitoxin module